MDSNLPAGPRAAPRPQWCPGLTAKVLSALAAGAWLLAVPAAAQAAAPPRPASSGAALCDGVPASSISSVVGWAVPDPVASVTKEAFNKKLHISSQNTRCTYGSATSISGFEHEVLLSYDHLSSAPSKPALVKYIKGEMHEAISQLPTKATASYSISTSNGVLVLYAKFGGTIDGVAFKVQELANWAGTTVAAVVVYGDETTSTLQSLEKLADANVGLP
jgi:hypothetical protein